MVISHFAQPLGDESHRSPIGVWPLDSLGTSVPQTLWPGPHRVNPIHCKIVGTPMVTATKQ